ncbi:MAG: V-type ATPase subunit [Aigarchaeota archaeon]|nr:V-type ATPase subunit [Candidatus Calditenuaceae archaeon]
MYAWRGSLLSKTFIQELTSSRSLTDFVEALKATPYSHEAQQITPPLSALKIEHALRRRLVKTHHRLMTLEHGDRVLRALFDRYISRDFKIIFRGILAGLKGEELSRLVDLYAEELLGLRDVIARLIAAESPDDAVTIIRGYATVDPSIPIFEKTQDPAALEVEIDRWFMHGVLRALRRAPRTQRQNLRSLLEPIYLKFILTSVLRGKIWRLQPRDIWGVVEGLVEEPLKSLISVAIEADDIESLRRALSVMPKGSLPPLGDASTLASLVASLERGFREMLVFRARRSFLRPFDEPSLPIAMVLLLEEEVAQLVAVAAGIEQKVDTNILIESLIPLT